MQRVAPPLELLHSELCFVSPPPFHCERTFLLRAVYSLLQTLSSLCLIQMKRFLAAWFVVLAFVSSAVAGKSDGRLDIYWVDVEGGAATLIVTPAGESVLIDTGNPGVRDPERI